VEGVWYYVLYLQNVPAHWDSSPGRFPHFGHTWTLAIEEQFYLVWPLLVVALMLSRRTLCITSLGLVGASLVSRLLGTDSITLLAHFDGLALGAILACILPAVTRWPRGRCRAVFACIAVGAFSAYFVLWSRWQGAEFSGKDMVKQNTAILFISLSYFGLVALLVVERGAAWLSPLRSPALCYIGSISYGLYLFHWIVYEILDVAFVFRWGYAETALWLHAIKLTTSFAIAALSWRFIESPILRLKDGFSYERGVVESKKDVTALQPS
jgi:peptidoglycan/LPS O-acetylase OafA/YrhL